MRIQLPYGEHLVDAELARGTCLGTLDVADVPALADPGAAIRGALRDPIGLPEPVAAGISAADRIAVVVSDSFRQTRADVVLPVLIGALRDAGADAGKIEIVFSTGTHRGPTESEQREILGEAVFEEFRDRLHTHDPFDEDNLVYVGTTGRGTRVEINRRIVEADRVYATGAVVFHYFGGFGGGRKSIVPGLASVETIAQNHALNLDPHADRLNPDVRIGAMRGNPVAEDMLEATKFARVDAIVNTVLNKDGAIAGVFAGDLEAAHEAAAAFAREIFAVPIAGRADLVIAASAGTKNFVQTHKALFNAYQAVKPDGQIVLLAPCPEGIGGPQFTKWLDLGSRGAIIGALRERSEINGQTALSSLEKGPITTMVTEMPDGDVARLHAAKADSLAEALARAVDRLAAAEPTYYVMPSAAYTVPFPPA